MKKKINNFMFSIYCCLGGKFIVAVSFYLLFLIFHFEKNYLLMCNYYNMSADDLNSFLLFIFFDGFFLIMFLPVVILAASWKVFQFLNCDCLKLLKCKNRTGIIQRYLLFSFTIITGIMAYLLLCILLVGKMVNMHFVLDDTFIPNLFFTYVCLLAITLTYLVFAVIFSSNSMGIVGAMIPILFELIVWKNHIKSLFKYTFFYNIVVQDDVQITVPQKIIFWMICLSVLIVILLIVIRHVDLGITRNMKEVIKYISEKNNIDPYFLGSIIWSCIYVAMTYHISKNFYSDATALVYICFRGFSGWNVQDLLFYLGLCMPLWVFLVYYFSKFFTTFSVYMFMKMGGVLKCMLKCMLNMVRYIILYFVIMMLSAYMGGRFIYKGNGKTDIYQNLQCVTDGMIGVAADFILVTLLLVLLIMVIYLLCYRLEIAFVIGIGCHILSVIIARFIPHGTEFIPFTQNILLIRNAKYNILWARSFLCLTLVVGYIIFCYLMKRKQEKILIGYYQ